MIHTFAITKDFQIKKNLPLMKLLDENIKWYWVDFDCPNPSEAELLDTFFHFHQLAIEDCLHGLQRPKIDFYQDYSFFVLHALEEETLEPEEIDIFIGTNYIVSFHQKHLPEIDEVWLKVNTTEQVKTEGCYYIFHQILDKTVDHYFPAVYKIETQIERIGASLTKDAMDKVFQVRSDLLTLRRTITQMKDLMYRILNSSRLEEVKKKNVFFVDVYDHLLRISEMLESSQAMTSEIRDSFLSINSHRMNNIMMVLTVISAIFIPLTFIAGVYGMNFEFMPELHWRYGYFVIMGLIIAIGVSMFLWFKRKGWLDMK